ncbi:hypothetical protein AJ78_07013 [Emergomyces pasteurianus Ep9510]|uniref:TRIP4/RQT4 C2HC5-type zinc finger domain-containing protein n=1 Tax=Emergomyces pasteurianus Ep9510 TaxID=1447872 RepID=A0A1J9Q8Y2_9EURO|nr:hypothetical protein AJ78_07013 [Emergomyces pasteurianus Ep9510]
MASLDTNLKSWALPRLSALLGLDDDSLTQLLEYTYSLGPDQGAEHLRNILGDSARALEFIVGFGERWRKSGIISGGRANHGNSGNNNGGGGYGGQKKMGGKQLQPQQQQERQPPSASGPLISEYLPNVRSKAAKLSAAKKQQHGQSSSSPSPSRNRNRNSPSTSAFTSTKKTTTTTSNIADLTAAIAQLELTTNPSLSTTSRDPKKMKELKPRKCNCQATRHPLFTPAPNCLGCGKIICALEGLQPCSFCHQPLLSAGQVQEMIRELRAERGSEKMRAHNRSVQGSQRQHDGRDVDLGGGSNDNDDVDNDDDDDGDTGNSGSRSSNTMRDLAAAKAHRDKLLHFQAQNARRTKVVDEVAEFETPDVHAGSTLWMSAGQRALALKRQQKVLREMEERGKEEWEKRSGGVVVSLSFEGGGVGKKGQKGVLKRVERVEEVQQKTEEVEEAEEDEEVALQEEQGGRRGFGNNPLLAGGGLVRPVWKGKDVDGDQSQSGSRRERRQKQTWRRVQDDDGDNEKWILDGGLYGYGNERREEEEDAGYAG